MTPNNIGRMPPKGILGAGSLVHTRYISHSKSFGVKTLAQL